MDNNKRPIENLTFEQSLAELEEIVKKIDSGQEELDIAIASFERGILLKNHCEKKLQDARLKIEKITKTADNDILVEEVKL